MIEEQKYARLQDDRMIIQDVYGRKTFRRYGEIWVDTKYDGQSEAEKN